MVLESFLICAEKDSCKCSENCKASGYSAGSTPVDDTKQSKSDSDILSFLHLRYNVFLLKIFSTHICTSLFEMKVKALQLLKVDFL